MNQCVPGWDVSRQGREPELAGGLPQIAFAVSKSKSSDQQQLCGPNEMADYVPDYNEVAELTWVNGHLAMQGLGSKAHNRHHHRSSGLACHWTDADHTCAAAARSQENEKEVDGTLDAIVLHEATRYDTDSVGNLPPLDDDTVSWFPLNYFSEHEAGLSRKAVNEELKSTKNTVRSTAETAQVDAANPANVESFDALVPSNINTDRCNNYLVNHSNAPKGNCTEVDEDEVPTPATIAARDNVNGSMNFAHFSRPAVMIKANLHTLGIVSGPTNVQRVRQHFRNMNEYHHQQRQDAGNVSGSDANVPASIVGSTNGLSTNSISSEEISRSTSLHIVNKTSRSLPSAVTSDDCLTKALHQDQSRNYSMSGSAGTIGREIASETCDALDITFASTSGGTPTNSTEKNGKETSWKRKSRTEEDSGCQSEDMEDESAQPVKKSQSGRSSSTKRSRAAAVHNQSERRRRDRINERMKALQKLIPNSSKTDKASMLDEAIEYLKQLQAQLQIMSIRNGLNLPAAMMPLGMQPLQMSLLAPLAPMGLGIGMSGVGLGMGMGMMDMNSIAAGGCGMVPIHGTGAHALQPATFIQPNLAAFSTTSDGNDRMQSSVMLDPYTAFMAGQRQSMNMDLYNTMALHQQQLHQHQKHCLSQQQDNNSGKSNQ